MIASKVLWFACVLSILGWHGWMVAEMWGGWQVWTTLADERPVVSGNHPLHQFHGWLGARSLVRRASLCCYDPRFQAGSIRSPVYSSGGQLASLFYLAAWGSNSPRAYKLGLAVATLLVPILLLVAATGFGLRPAAALAAAGLGVAVWWSQPAQSSFAAGHIDRLFAGVLVVAWLGLLARFDRRADVGTWVVKVALGATATFVQPLAVLLALPLLLLYYFDAGARHRGGLWHLALAGGLLLIVAVNLAWLLDWAHAWWLRTPPEDVARQPRTLRNLWECSTTWGSLGDRLLFAGLICGGGFALFALRREAWRRLRLAVFAVPYLLAVVVLGHGQRLGELVGTHGCLFPALWLAAIVLADRLAALASSALAVGGVARASLSGAAAIGVAVAIWSALARPEIRPAAFDSPAPLRIGLSDRQWAAAELLAEKCDRRGRLLWEDLPGDSAWPLYLVLRAGCASIGAWDVRGETIFAAIGLRDGRLAGVPIEACSDADLSGYCRRYNVGWIAARSEKSRRRLHKWARAIVCGRVDLETPVELFRIDLEQSGYAVRGKATLVEAGCSRLTFADVEPEDGEVVLAFHHVGSITAYPRRVRVERESDARWPLPLIRLRMAGRVSRVTLEWRPR